jgi:acyl dehydratase
VIGRYFEEIAVGDEIESLGQTVTEASIIAFASQYDPQWFHLDVVAAAESPYGGLIASGLQTLAVGFRMFIDSGVLARTSLGSPGFEDVRFLRPVRPGDTLHTIVRVNEAKASESKPDRGLVKVTFRVLNQSDDVVLTFNAAIFVKRKPQ